MLVGLRGAKVGGGGRGWSFAKSGPSRRSAATPWLASWLPSPPSGLGQSSTRTCRASCLCCARTACQTEPSTLDEVGVGKTALALAAVHVVVASSGVESGNGGGKQWRQAVEV